MVPVGLKAEFQTINFGAKRKLATDVTPNVSHSHGWKGDLIAMDVVNPMRSDRPIVMVLQAALNNQLVLGVSSSLKWKAGPTKSRE